ncbi:MAG: cysteine--tRNA ligase [Acidobacteria bacterium]|nr:cysteine--tRNA ligase [Acidobacteriota bacterium]
MALKLHNTLTSELEELKPLDGKTVRMYTCGPTVYDFVHIGNFRTFVFQDLLRRYIKYKGFPILHVMNITDVDDKIIRKAGEAGVPISEYTNRYVQAFLEDIEKLRIEKPDVTPFATEHIDDMVDLVLKLRDKGHTYESDGSTYYRINTFGDYGKLSRLDLSHTQPEDRVDSDEYTKENPRDFVLWKARKEGEAFWDTPLGPGRPGWHLECSTMSMKYLGESFDIHCGGVDLIFPHHENEIAQSEAATNKPFVSHWIHSEFLLVESNKMSKSEGNQYTLQDLMERGCDPLAIRYLLQSVHYRKQLNFSFAGVEQARSALRRIHDFLLRVGEVPHDRPENPDLSQRVGKTRSDFLAGLDEDLNTSVALGVLFELIKDTNILLERQEVGTANRDQILSLFADANQVFAVLETEESQTEDQEILGLIQERKEARRQRDFRRADEIRDLLASRGIVLEDTKAGTRWKRAG